MRLCPASPRPFWAGPAQPLACQLLLIIFRQRSAPVHYLLPAFTRPFFRFASLELDNWLVWRWFSGVVDPVCLSALGTHEVARTCDRIFSSRNYHFSLASLREPWPLLWPRGVVTRPHTVKVFPSVYRKDLAQVQPSRPWRTSAS